MSSPVQCQKCRTPLRLDSSLEDLSESSINLLLDATSNNLHNIPSTANRPLYTPSQHQLFVKASANNPQPAVKRTVGPWPASTPALGRDQKADMSFIMLTESQLVSPDIPANTSSNSLLAYSKASKADSSPSPSPKPSSRSHETPSFKAARAARLFEVLSSRTDIDFPICTECTSTLTSSLEHRLAAAQKERSAYADFLRHAHADVPTAEERATAAAELRAVQDEEAAALAELEKLELEHAQLEREIDALDAQSAALDAEEADFWRERNAFGSKLRAFEDERDSLNVRYEHDARLLERLQRTNVYNDTFCISHDGYFGTINGLRLGRMSGSSVEWSEVNAAWGQACLLLATVADKLGYQFQGYKLNPMGSTSTIDKIELPQRGAAAAGGGGGGGSGGSGGVATTTTGQQQQQQQNPVVQKTATTTSLALFYSSDLPLNISFLHRHFDSAMVAFLECVRQLGAHVERATRGTLSGGDAGLRLPYDIKKDRIHDCSVKLSGFGGDESWTRACKYTLTCCKFLLAHASNIGGARKGGPTNSSGA